MEQRRSIFSNAPNRSSILNNSPPNRTPTIQNPNSNPFNDEATKQLQDNLRKAEAELRVANARQSELDSRLQAAQSEITRLKALNPNKENASGLMTGTKLGAIQAQIQAERMSHDQELSSLRKQLEKAKETLSKEKTKSKSDESLSKKHELLTKEHEALNHRLIEKTLEVEKLRNSLSKSDLLEAEINRLSNELNDTKELLDKANDTNIEQKDEISKLNSKLNRKAQDSLQSVELQSAIEQISQIQSKLNSLEKDYSTSKSSLRAKAQECDSLHLKLAQATSTESRGKEREEELERLRMKCLSLANERDTYLSYYNNLSNENEALRGYQSEFEAIRNSLEIQLGELRTSEQILKTGLEERDRKIEETTKSLTIVSREVDLLRRGHKIGGAEISLLERNKENLLSEFNSLQSAHAELSANFAIIEKERLNLIQERNLYLKRYEEQLDSKDFSNPNSPIISQLQQQLKLSSDEIAQLKSVISRNANANNHELTQALFQERARREMLEMIVNEEGKKVFTEKISAFEEQRKIVMERDELRVEVEGLRKENARLNDQLSSAPLRNLEFSQLRPNNLRLASSYKSSLEAEIRAAQSSLHAEIQRLSREKQTLSERAIRLDAECLELRELMSRGDNWVKSDLLEEMLKLKSFLSSKTNENENLRLRMTELEGCLAENSGLSKQITVLMMKLEEKTRECDELKVNSHSNNHNDPSDPSNPINVTKAREREISNLIQKCVGQEAELRAIKASLPKDMKIDLDAMGRHLRLAEEKSDEAESKASLSNARAEGLKQEILRLKDYLESKLNELESCCSKVSELENLLGSSEGLIGRCRAAEDRASAYESELNRVQESLRQTELTLAGLRSAARSSSGNMAFTRTLEEEIYKLKDILTSKIDELDCVMEENSSLRSQAESNREAIARVHDSNDHIARLMDELSRQSSVISRRAEECEALRKQVSNLQGELWQANHIREEAINLKGILEEKLDELEETRGRVNKLEIALANVEAKDNSSRIRGLTRELESCRSNCLEKEHCNEELRMTILRLESQIKSLSSSATTNASLQQRLVEVTELRKRVHELESKSNEIAYKEREARNTIGRVRELEQELDMVSTDLAAVHKENANLRNQLISCAGASNELMALTKELGNTQNLLRERQSQLENAREELALRNRESAELAGLKEQIGYYEEERAMGGELRMRLEYCNERLSSMTQERDEAERKRILLAETVETLREHLASAIRDKCSLEEFETQYHRLLKKDERIGEMLAEKNWELNQATFDRAKTQGLLAQHEEMRSQLLKMKDFLSAKVEENEDLSDALHEREEELEMARKDGIEALHRIETLSKDLAYVQAQVRKAESLLEAMRQAEEISHETLATFQREMAFQQQAQVVIGEQIEVANSSQLATLISKVEQLVKEKSQLESQLSAISRGQSGNMEFSVSREREPVSRTIEEKEKALAEATKVNSFLSRDNQRLQADMKRRFDDIEDLKEELEKVKREKNNSSNMISYFEQENEALRSKLQEKERSLLEREKSLIARDQLPRFLEDSKNQDSGFLGISGISGKPKRPLQGDIDTEEIAKLRARNETLAAELQSISQEFKDLKENNTKRNPLFATFNKKPSNISKAPPTSDKLLINNLESEIKSLKGMLEVKSKEIEFLRRRLGEGEIGN